MLKATYRSHEGEHLDELLYSKALRLIRVKNE